MFKFFTTNIAIMFLQIYKIIGSLAKSCVEILNILCIIVHNQKKMKMIRAFCSFNDFMLLSLWKQVFNSLHHKLIRLKPIIFLENRALCAKITFGIKYFMRISAILAALLHFHKKATTKWRWNYLISCWMLAFIKESK